MTPEELAAAALSADEDEVRDAVRACGERMRGAWDDDRVGLAIVLVDLARSHPSERVREAVAKVCDAFPDPFFDDALAVLAADVDHYVRDHARRAADRRAVHDKAKKKRTSQEREVDAILAEIEDKGARRLAERAARRKAEDFTARLYHELAKVQDAVNGSLQRLSAELEAPEPSLAALRRHAAEVRARVDYVHAIVKRGREYAAQVKPVLRRVSVAGLVEEARVQLLARLGARAHEIAFTADVEPGLAMDADAHAMLQALQNLLQNAVEAYGDGVTRRPVRVVARGRRAGSEVVIEVVDEGPGMSDDARENLFRPFHTTKPGGTGVGLLVAKARVDDVHEGTLAIESARGAGTKVTIVIPARRAGTEEGEEMVAERETGR